MKNRIVFLTTTSSELTFANSKVISDGEMTCVWHDGERIFMVPTKNVVAIETLPEQQGVPAPPPEPQPVPASGPDA